MQTPTTKSDHPLSIRLPSDDLAMIDRASKLTGRSRSDFMREAALREAEQIVMAQTLQRFSQSGFKAFKQAIEAPAQVVPELAALMQRKAPWE